MSFLTPFFLLGLGAIAVPILVHLVQRERKRVVEFPSLMFVQRIPYQSVRRRRVRHWLLLAARIAALILIALAFARPFLPERAAAAVTALGGNRELVVLLDRSASMGYEDRWTRAQTAAREAIASIGVNDKATLVLFDRNTEELVRATADRGRLESAVDAAKVTGGATRFGPAIKLAESILARSTLQRREAVLISDFQKTGWTGAEDAHFSETMRLTPVSVGSANATNLAVPSVSFARAPFSGQERITVTAGVANKGPQAVASIPVTLEIDRRVIETQNVNVAANASASVVFAPFTLAEPFVRGVVRAGTDALAIDNAFHFVVTPNQSLSVLIVDNGDAVASFYLSKALAIGATPRFEIEIVPASRVSPAMLEGRAAVVLNDAMLPPGLAGGALQTYVEGGGGLLVVLGERSVWPSSEATLLPGTLGAVHDRTGTRGGTIVVRDYSHPAFEIFKAPRSGDFSAARIQRYRTLDASPTDRILAKYDDGAVAAAERKVGSGRVIAWTTAFDDRWNDLPKKAVFLPLVHQLVKYLGQHQNTAAWRTVGDVIDLSNVIDGKGDRVVVTPANDRVTMRAADDLPLELSEQGVYEVRAADNASARPARLAVNIDPAESDLAPMDPQELLAAVTGRANPNAVVPSQAAAELTATDAERRQGLWWYLLMAGLLLLAGEVAAANVLSRKERFL